MFSFCCPKITKGADKNGIDQKLIQVGGSPQEAIPPTKRVILCESDRKKQSSIVSQKFLPVSNLQKLSSHVDSKYKLGYEQKQEAEFGIRPFFDQNFKNPKNSGIGSKMASKSKGQLFQFQHNTQIVYYDTKKGDQFCLRFLITKKPIVQKETKSIINFILAKKSQNPNEQQELILIIPSKMLYESKHLHIPNNVHAIFTNMSRSQKNNSANFPGQIIEIIEGNQDSIKTASFDKIIIILEGENDVEYIINYCQQLARRYSIEQFLKIWWIFPSFLGLQDINQIIKQTLRKFIINQTIGNVAKYLYYEIDVIKQLNLQPFMLVRNKRWRDFKNTKNKLQSRDQQTRICLAIGLFMVEVNQTVLPYYKYFVQNVFYDMKFIEYLKYKQLIQNEKQNFFKKLIFYNLTTEDGAKVLQQNRKMIEHKYEISNHRRFLIKGSDIKKFISAFGFQESIQTNQANTPIRQQWDDDLKLSDLQIRKGSYDKQQNTPGNDLNLFDEEDIDYMVLNDYQIGIVEQSPYQLNSIPLKKKQSKVSKKQSQQRGQLAINIQETETRVD